MLSALVHRALARPCPEAFTIYIDKPKGRIVIRNSLAETGGAEWRHDFPKSPKGPEADPGQAPSSADSECR